MKYDQLHTEIKHRFKSLEIEAGNNQIVVLCQKDYDLLFGGLLTYQQEHKNKLKVDLIAQLNSYINAYRIYYSPEFRVKNPSKVIRPSPPLKEINLSAVHTIEALDSFLLSSLSANNLNPEELLGRLLYCAVRHGGLVNKPFLVSFLDCVCNKVMKSVDKLVWIELQGAVGEQHNWFPDNLTILLLDQFFGKNFTYEHVRVPEHYIAKFMALAPTTLNNKLTTSWLFSTIKARLSLSITPFALDILTSDQINVTLKETPFLRLVTQKSPPLSSVISDVEKQASFDEIEKDKLEKRNEKQIEANYSNSEELLMWTKNQLIALRLSGRSESMSNIMKSKTSALAKQIDEKLASNSRKITSITRSIIEWVTYSLTTGSKWSGRLKPSSLISYIASISKRLQLYFGYRDPLEMDLEEIAHIYLMIIDDGRNVAVKARRARILRDFHEVLEVKYKVEPCYIFQEFITIGNDDKVNLVDANILMPGEYETATAFLTQSNELTGLTEIQRKAVHVALILGFRCGFRRSELHYLKIQDLEWDLDSCGTIPEWATILISYSELRDLKSISAHRRLPVGLLLTKQELCVLNDYCRLRLQLTLDYSDFLFYFDKRDPLLGRALQVVSANQLFTPLTTLLQRVTGDNTFRYHHLRHSFATWLFWYWTGDIHKFSHPIPTLQKHSLFEHLSAAREALLHRAPDEPSRKTLHTISSLIGHSGPSITLFHYIHSAAWIIWSDLQQQLPDTSAGFNDVVRATVTNVTTRTLYRKNENSENCSAYFDGFLRFIHSELAKFATAIDTSTWSSINFTAIEAVSSEMPFKVSEITLYKALLEYFNGKLARRQCIAMFSVDENAFNHSINNVRYFFSQRQSRFPQGKKSNASKNHERRDSVQGKNVNKLPERKLKKLPKSKENLDVILHIISRYHELSDSQKRVILLAAKYMVDFCSVEWPDIRLSLNDSLQPSGHYWLKTWLDAIKLLDNDNDLYKYVRLTLVCRHPIGSSEREHYWEAWTKGLSIPNRYDRYHGNYPKKALIRLDFMDFKEFKDAVGGMRRRRDLSKRICRVPSQQGFRLAFYIIFFIHYIDESHNLEFSNS